MSRRNTAKRRIITPDPIYNSKLISMLTSRILKHGKKSLAQKIIYEALEIINSKILNLFFKVKSIFINFQLKQLSV